jgi:nitroreductase
MDSLSNPTNETLQTLLSRRSHWPLAAPGPTKQELDLIIDVALRAPDHARLRPWRFVTVRGAARLELGDVLIEAAARAPGDSRIELTCRIRAALEAPLVIALGAAIQEDPLVPEIEQLLSVGAAAMNMLNAVHALGLGGYWITGEDCYDARVHDAFGFWPTERLVGFLYIGTPVVAQADIDRPRRQDYVREWGTTSA